MLLYIIYSMFLKVSVFLTNILGQIQPVYQLQQMCSVVTDHYLLDF